MFLDPVNDCPDKLIWALIGWLAWEERPETFREELAQLRELLDYVFENRMLTEEQQTKRSQEEASDRELLRHAKESRIQTPSKPE
jgi:hypothetical protein